MLYVHVTAANQMSQTWNQKEKQLMEREGVLQHRHKDQTGPFLQASGNRYYLSVLD